MTLTGKEIKYLKEETKKIFFDDQIILLRWANNSTLSGPPLDLRVCIFIFKSWYNFQIVFAFPEKNRAFVFQCCLTNYHKLSYLLLKTILTHYLTISIDQKFTHGWIELSALEITRLKSKCHQSYSPFWSSGSSFKFKCFLKNICLQYKKTKNLIICFYLLNRNHF